ncbi:hypothetical protein [Mesorhizobium amorphae]|uniref:hypothetical protein n=1 Tax=Mesorhizobium amorphae TaxID=71433 RepID=UPI00178307F1|nr:hypothetical protein [Mesorhizobium amorphae]
MTMKYPFVEDTLGKKVAIGTGLSVDCMTCRHSAVLDVAALARRLGDDYGCMHWDLIKVLHCQPCRDAGRPDRNLHFTNRAVTPDARR